MKTIKIKGKEYVMVVERVKEFHKLFPRGHIETQLVLPFQGNLAIVKATVHLGDGRTFTGFSGYPYGEGQFSNAAVEVAETSAVGRALGFANIGLLADIASATELKKAGVEVDNDEPF